MITAALTGVLDNVGYRKHSIFGAEIPLTCPNVPSEILSARETWKNDAAFYEQANKLAGMFRENFKKFEEYANEEIMAGSPNDNNNFA